MYLFVALGATDASLYLLVAVTLYYGNIMLDRGTSHPREIILVVLSMLFGGARVGQALPQIDHISSAVSAANVIFSIIDRVRDYLDSSSYQFV